MKLSSQEKKALSVLLYHVDADDEPYKSLQSGLRKVFAELDRRTVEGFLNELDAKGSSPN